MSRSLTLFFVLAILVLARCLRVLVGQGCGAASFDAIVFRNDERHRLLCPPSLAGFGIMRPSVGQLERDTLAFDVRVLKALGLEATQVSVGTDHPRQVVHKDVDVQPLCPLVRRHLSRQPLISGLQSAQHRPAGFGPPGRSNPVRR